MPGRSLPGDKIVRVPNKLNVDIYTADASMRQLKKYETGNEMQVANLQTKHQLG